MSTTNPPSRTTPREPTAPTPAPRRRRWPLVLAAVVLGLLVAGVGAFFVGYLTTDVPAPSRVATAQTSVLTYDDGKTEIARIGTHNRIDVRLAQVPLPVRHAVLAAEDRGFYDEPGVSVTGIARALWADLRGGGISQGGSTITQQYAKNAFLTQERTLGRKIREVFIAIKLDHSKSKDQILEDYLNAIYFGRGAYGIQTAAEEYFGRPVQRLTPAQGALLAAVIRAPSTYDPRRHPAAARQRWQYVVNGMVSSGWLSQADAAALRFPTTKKPSTDNELGGPDGYLVDAVQRELASKGIDEDALATRGYRVVTTLDHKTQQAAVHAEDKVLGDVKGPVSGMAAVEPGTGKILAMYGGRDYTGHQAAAQVNLATNRRPAGSSFKPYTLATALDQGIGLRTDFRGTSPLRVDGWNSKGHLVHNDSGEQFARCDLICATAHSVNTVYAQLVMEVGPKNVATTAHAAGVQAPLADASGDTVPSITLGVYGVSPLDQADGYATFAAEGMHAAPYLVDEVRSPRGAVVYRAKPATSRAFSKKVAADATYAMQKVVQYGTGTRADLDGRPAAGKTGTTSSNTDAWFAGFTPQLAAAVWLGNVDNAPLTNVQGYERGIYGGQLPAEVWKAFMDRALDGRKVEHFPDPAYVGDTSRGVAPPPAPAPTAAPTATVATGSPTHQPSASPTAPPTRTPSAAASPSPSRRPTPVLSPSRRPGRSGSPLPRPSVSRRSAHPSPSPSRAGG